MTEAAPTIEVGDRVEHYERPGTVDSVFASGICIVWFDDGGGVSAPMKELKLVKKAVVAKA